MILWTVQDERVLHKLGQGSPYTVDDDHIMFPENEHDNCNHAYRWMVKQMTARIGPPPDGTHYPIWAWYKCQGRPDGKPDMRSWRAEEDATHVVRLKLDVPDWDVLLTDFDDWNCALNYWYLPRNMADQEAFDKMVKLSGHKWFDVGDMTKTSPHLEKARRILERSWDRMIGVREAESQYCDLPWKFRTIQATFWQIKPEYVISAKRFRARH